MKLFLTRQRALETYPITPAELDDLVSGWTYPLLVTLDFNGHQEAGLYTDALATYVADRDIKPAQFEHLRGNLLGMSEAAVKYRLRISTVSSWARQEVLQVKGEEGLKKLVDEADVAYLAAKSYAKNIRSGKKVFS